jgi:hypothetical protein
VVVLLLVAPAGEVVGEDPAGLPLEVVSGEQGEHGQAPQRVAEVAPDHRGQPVGLALQGQDGALDLLVVLQLHLEELDDLDRDPGAAGDAHGGVLVGRKDLLHVAVGDEAAHRGPPVTGQHDTVGEGQADDGRAVRRVDPLVPVTQTRAG